MRRIRFLALVVAVTAVVAPPNQARAAGSFTFYGSGWGHGLGMSQWGAYGLAKSGWTHDQILTHFYTGTKVVQAPVPKTVRVDLADGLKQARLGAEVGPVQLWVGQPSAGQPVATIPAGETWTVVPGSPGYQLQGASGQAVGTFGGPGPQQHLYATFEDAGSHLTIPQAGATYNRGVVEFNLTSCSSRCRIRLILAVGFEDYLLGVGEVPSSWPKEALEAQVIAARSYAMYKIRNDGVQAACNCDLYDGSNDQVYIGWNKEGGPDGARWVAAVRDTTREIVEFRGSVALTVFTASDGGHTEDVDVQWGTPLSSFPYLAGVCDPGDYTAANPWTDWNRSFTDDAVTRLLRPITGDIGAVTGFTDAERGVSGRITQMSVQGASGTASVTGSELRSALDLPDDRVWVGSDRNVLGAIRTRYDALMCRPGLPTSSTKALPGGSRQTFQVGAIYANAGAGVTVWLKGPIYDEYLGVGGATGALGLPVSPVIGLGKLAGSARGECDATCVRVDFAGGRIYLKSTTGAYALWGKVLASYLDHDGVVGKLGYPVSCVEEAGNGTMSATFEHGSIACKRNGTCRVSFTQSISSRGRSSPPVRCPCTRTPR